MKTPKEVWKYIPGYNKKYQVSNIGRMRRGLNCCPRKRPFELLNIKIDPHGYPVIDIYLNGNSSFKRLRVHRLLLITFKRLPKQNEICRHLNDIKTDNRLKNLCWGTKSENQKDFFRNGGKTGFCVEKTLKKAVRNRIKFYALRKSSDKK